MRGWNPFTRLPIVVLAVAAALPAPAPAAAAQDVAQVFVGSGSIELEPLIEHGRLVLTVSGPMGFHHRAVFAAGEAPVFSIFGEAGGALPDGSYTWELRAVPVDVQRRDTDAGGEMASTGGRGSQRLVQSGSFAILGGAVVAGGETEAGAGGPTNVLGAKDQVVADDLIVNGSNLCVGFDCVNGENFGFDTIRLKESNTRLQFDDTSVSVFPSNNWQIRANETTAGGASFLGIVDQGVGGNSETGTLVFLVEAGAPQNALRVDSTGRVGFGTATPVLHLHAVDGNTPGLRLEQDGSSGFTPQTWDVAGNEVGFFVRDVTHGSRLPLRIEPEAPSNTVYLAASGSVGLGTSTPAARLDVIGDIAVSGTVDGRDVSADGAALDTHVTDFDNPHQVTAAQLGIEEDQTKAGIVAAAAFAGNPATATVTFATPFPAGTSYALLLTGVTSDDGKTAIPTVVAKSETGFTVTLGNGNTSHVVEVGWLARPLGE